MENTRWTSPTNHGMIIHRPRMTIEQRFEGWCEAEGLDVDSDEVWEDFQELLAANED